jgi:ankyrin repeat protein
MPKTIKTGSPAYSPQPVKLQWDLDEKEKYKIMELINKRKWKKILKKYNPRDIDFNGNNLLHIACMKGHEEAIDKILRDDPNLFYVANAFGETCSHILLKNNWQQLFQKYYVKYPDIITFIDNYGNTIAQIIIDQPVILQWLINKIPPAYKDSMNNLTLEGHTLLAQLVKVTSGKDVYFDIIKDLVQQGVNINAGSVPPLTYATINNNIDVAQLLLKYGANPNIRNQQYMTLLIFSVNSRNPEMTNLLLKHGADVNYGGPEGDDIPLNIAIKNKDTKTLNVLMKYKPDLHQKDRKLNTPLHYLSKSLSHEQKNTSKDLWIKPSKAFRIFYKGNLDQENIDGETPRKLIKDSKFDTLFSELINSKKSIHYERKTRILSQSKMINFLERVAKNEMSRNQYEDLCNNKYGVEQCKSIIKNQILTGKSTEHKLQKIDIPLSEEKHHGLFNSDIIHNCIYTIIILNKFKELMIPTQTYIQDKATNDLRLLDNLNAYRTKYGTMLFDIVKIYTEFAYELVPHLIVWRDRNTNYINKNLKFYLQDLLNSSKVRFIYIKITLVPTLTGTHANLLLYDKETHELIRFEPYGFVEVLDEDILNETLKNLGKDMFGKNTKYYKPKDYLKNNRFQIVSDDGNDDNRKMGDPFGYCLAWCYWFIELRLKNKNIELTTMIDSAFEEINKREEPTKFIDYIRNYAGELNSEKDKLMKKIGISEKEIYDVNYKDENINKISEFVVNEITKLKKIRLE